MSPPAAQGSGMTRMVAVQGLGVANTWLALLHTRSSAVQGSGTRRATCKCNQPSELLAVNIADYKRILAPLQSNTLQLRMAFLKQVSNVLGVRGLRVYDPVGTDALSLISEPP